MRFGIISGIEQLAGRETAVGKAVLVAKQLIAAKEALLGLEELQRRAAETKAKAQLSIAEGQAKTASTGFPQNIPLLLAYAAQAITIISRCKKALSMLPKELKGYYSGGLYRDRLFV